MNTLMVLTALAALVTAAPTSTPPHVWQEGVDCPHTSGRHSRPNLRAHPHRRVLLL